MVWLLPHRTVILQQQQGPRIPRGHQAKLVLQLTEALWEAERLGILTGAGCTVQGSHPPIHCFVRDFFFDQTSWELYSYISASVINIRSLSHHVCMLNWLLVGDGDILGANYYVLSCTVPSLAVRRSLNTAGQERAFSQRKEKNWSLLWIRMQSSNPAHVINCPLYH